MSGALFVLLLRVIRRLSGVTIDKSSSYLDKIETFLLSLRISFSVGFSILVLLVDKLVIEVDPDLSIELSI